MTKPKQAKSAGSCRFYLLLPALFLFSLSAAQAFKLVPITMEFDPAGRGANRAFRLENDSTNTVPIQISILSRQVDLEGTETNAPADDDFLVYPPQILLKPKQVQTVRVKWLGDPNPKKELCYRILAEQMPVNLEKEKPRGSGIELLVRYLGSVYIVPKGAKADVMLESAVSQNDAAGKRQIAMVFHNRGTAHAILRDLQLTIQAGDKTIVLGTETLPNVAGENLLAGQKRRFTIVWPEGLPEGEPHVTFEFKKRP